MNYILLRKILQMSKYTFYGICLQLVVAGMLLASTSEAQRQSLEKIYITVDIDNLTLEDALQLLSDETEFNFSYNDIKINEEKIITASVKNKSMASFLKRMSKDYNLKFKRINENIYVSMKEKSGSDVEEEFTSIFQEREVIGKVTSSEDNSGLPGVNVMVKGSATGTITDVEGSYKLNVPEGGLLVFSYVGYLSEVVEVGVMSVIDVSLAPDITQLSEIVVIGYGTREKKDLTGAISTINSKELNNEIKLSPELALQGKMAGVYVSNPGSDPTARPTVRIRGVSTLGFNDPLYVVDGVPLYEGGASSGVARDQDLRGPVNVLSLINPNDIESISVLKDASATAIYGVRASNGVILIQTKRGQEGKAKVSFSASYGVQNIKKRYDVLPTSEYASLFREAYDNNTSEGLDDNDWAPLFDPASPEYLGNDPTYDWMEEATVKNAKIQDYNVNISGGNGGSNYAVGFGYTDQEDALYYNSLERYSFFANSDHQLTDWLKIGESFRMTVSNTDVKPGAGLTSATLINPWQPLFDPNGLNGYALPGREIEGSFNSYGYGNSTRNNFLGQTDYQVEKRELIRTMGSFYAEVSPLDGLRFRGTVSFDGYTNLRERFIQEETGYFSAQTGVPNTNGTTYARRTTGNRNLVLEFLIGYQKSFGNHNIDVVLNAMDQKINWTGEQYGAINTGLLDWDQRRVTEGWPREDKQVLYERTNYGLIGYMGRLSYNYDSKYYFDATVRRDGSSRFGPGYKWGTFPSFAGAWRISSEDFMQSATFINDLKIRVGWGKTGNQETRDFAYLSLVNFNPKYILGSTGDPGAGNIISAAALGDFPIIDMTWETVTTQNIGFDALLWKNKINFTAEYYSRETEGILQAIEIPKVIGALNNPVVNLATVENKGVELVLGYNDNFGDLGFSANFNFTTVDNNVTKLYRNLPQGGESRIEVGYPINFIRGYQVGGIFQTQQEVDDWLLNTADPGNDSQKAPGDMYFQDNYGPAAEDAGDDEYRSVGADGVVDVFDQDYLGTTIPGYYYGLNVGLNYKGFDLGITFRGVGDVQKINGIRRSGEQMNTGGVNYLTTVNNRWTSSNPSETMPRAISSDPSSNNRMSDRWVEDAGFFRLQNAQLGYNFTGSAIERAKISNLRLYLSASNVFVVSPYTGLDPENDTTPNTFVVGLNLGF